MEMFSFFFLEAKIRDETSSEALEQSGVTYTWNVKIEDTKQSIL